MNQQTLKGQWNQLKGKVREKWGQLTDDEVTRTEGNLDQLIGLIQRKTGESRSRIESFLDGISKEGESLVNRLAETAQEYAEGAAETIQNAANQAYDAARRGVVETQRMVQRHPFESVGVCFGAGLAAGIAIGLLIRMR